MKTVYIAARFARKEEVKAIYSKLQPLRYVPSKDWTNHRAIKPYDAHPELAREYAIDDVNGARNSDLFILLSDAEGTGMHTELGIALERHLEFGKPQIYVIGEHLSRSFFFYHPAVKRRENIEDVIRELSEG